ncbi:MAG: N-acetylmuramoyl-L-alanine amidase [Candidatus Aenigmatarchaeota archaeon]
MKNTIVKIIKILLMFIFLLIINKNILCLPLQNIKICIDPGHGGNEPGAIGPTGLKEKDENLIIANKLYNLLTDNGGALVYQTRHTDNFVSLEDRMDYSNNIENLSWFISIHLNSSNDNNINGSEVWYFYSSQTCKNMAIMMSYELSNKLGINNRGAKASGPSPYEKNIFVLAKSINPADLAECSFISNSAEENLLKTTDREQIMAQAIYDGIVDYFTPPYAKKVIIYQDNEKKYEAEWQEGTMQRNLNILLNRPISNHTDANLSIEFIERIKNVMVKIEGREITGAVGGDGKIWSGIINKDLLNVFGNGLKTIEILAIDYAGNEIDGNPQTIANYNTEDEIFENSENPPDGQHRFNIKSDIALYSSRNITSGDKYIKVVIKDMRQMPTEEATEVAGTQTPAGSMVPTPTPVAEVKEVNIKDYLKNVLYGLVGDAGFSDSKYKEGFKALGIG